MISTGKGGNVYIIGDHNFTGLNFETFHFNAGDGRHGSGKNLTGRTGDDVYVRVPRGTIVTEVFTEEMLDFMEEDGLESTRTYEIDKDQEMILVAEGGKAGIGNAVMAGTSTRRARSMPATNIPGARGQHRSLLLELKLIADVGLVGYPNVSAIYRLVLRSFA